MNKKNWPISEKYMATNPAWLFYYSKDVIKGRLPEELHNRMLAYALDEKYKKYAEKYLSFIKCQ